MRGPAVNRELAEGDGEHGERDFEQTPPMTPASPRVTMTSATHRAVGIPLCRIALGAGRAARAATHPTLRHVCPASKPLSAGTRLVVSVSGELPGN
jgi:hypothetical protein